MEGQEKVLNSTCNFEVGQRQPTAITDVQATTFSALLSQYTSSSPRFLEPRLDTAPSRAKERWTNKSWQRTLQLAC